MSEGGFCLDASLLQLATCPPECLLIEFLHANKFADCPANNTEQNTHLNDPKADVWALGAVLFQFLFGLTDQITKDLLEPQRVVNYALNYLATMTSPSSGYAYLLGLYEIDVNKQAQCEQRIPALLIELMHMCLVMESGERPCLTQVVEFYEARLSQEVKEMVGESAAKEVNVAKWQLFGGVLRSTGLPITRPAVVEESDEERLWRLGVDEVYCLWRLAGGDLATVMAKYGPQQAVQLRPCQKLGSYVRVEDGQEFGKAGNCEAVLDESVVELCLEQLRRRLSCVGAEAFFVVGQVAEEERGALLGVDGLAEELKRRGVEGAGLMRAQPLNIRESDTEYQMRRMVVFARLLVGLPFTESELFRECVLDIPPMYRALSWGALLGCGRSGQVQNDYQRINKEIVTVTDRQIDVDVPRCHQCEFAICILIFIEKNYAKKD
jgi:TBC domain-containing protein kinase-like protein